ncbi:MAG: aminopeptidase P family protein [Planctomycetia bacterium]|nr:aminopeptidase P family protein [Planctomycetia bacterium]
MNGTVFLDPAACRIRQQRIRDWMEQAHLDLAIVVSPESIEYLTGLRWDFRFSPVAALGADGQTVLICPDKPVTSTAIDEVRTYEAKWKSTLRNDQREASSAILADWLTSRKAAGRVGVEFSACPPHVSQLLQEAELVDLEPELLRCRRKKDADEVACLRQAIAATEAMYQKAREIIRPGLSELEMFSALQAAAVEACGEMLTGTGNDYASGVRGGPPRDRCCQAGELYILDLGPAYRGYFADNARTLSVDGQPTESQLAAWQHVCGALELVERRGKAGVRCRDIYAEVEDWLGSATVGSWSSHLGHGIGLSVHETPHLNPNWDDTLEVGDVIAVEPALYAPELQCGMRIENDYLVTETGLELLSPFPLELTTP